MGRDWAGVVLLTLRVGGIPGRSAGFAQVVWCSGSGGAWWCEDGGKRAALANPSSGLVCHLPCRRLAWQLLCLGKREQSPLERVLGEWSWGGLACRGVGAVLRLRCGGWTGGSWSRPLKPCPRSVFAKIPAGIPTSLQHPLGTTWLSLRGLVGGSARLGRKLYGYGYLSFSMLFLVLLLPAPRVDEDP